MEYGSFTALPKRILDQYTRIECASFMGTLPELDRVWVTVDNKLFLWKYTSSASAAPLPSASVEFVPDADASADDCVIYDGISEVIVSVALSAPKPGVFLDSVRYVLVVASPVEVTLLAVTCDEQGNNFKLVPTAYTMPSDNVAMVKVVGSQAGRIFMAGNDGNVYELDYSNSESVWSALVDGGDENARHKCRKINHFAWNWRLVHLLPPFLKSFAAQEDNLVDLAVDNVRQVAYAVTAKGVLSTFYLGTAGTDTHMFAPAFNVLDAARNYLTYCRGLPEGSPKAESFNNPAAAAGFNVLSLHVLPITESRKVHVLVVLGNGIRIYLSLLTSTGAVVTALPSPQLPSDYYCVPSKIEVAYVRSPPSPAALRVSGNSRGRMTGTASAADATVDVENGSAPSYMPSQALKVSSALYSQGVAMMALDKGQHPDELVCLFEDLVGRTHLTLGLPPAYQQPSLREGVCIGLDETTSGGKIYAIKENCSQIHFPDVARLRAMYAHSSTPPNSGITDQTHHYDATSPSRSMLRAAKSGLGWLAGSGDEDARAVCTPASEVPVVFGAEALAMAAAPAGTGYDQFDLNQVALLGEMSWQHVPCASVSLQRQFLVLTNQGVHSLRKLRPADVLYRHLSQVNNLADDQCQYFFLSFGALEASAMCVALACGLPCDAGGDSNALSQTAAMRRPLETIQMRAMSVMLGLTQGPTYRKVGTGTGGAAPALKDSRLVLNDSSYEFVRSSAHDALYLVASRILRPLWLRAVVQGDSRISSTWTVPLIAEVRAPLVELQKLIKGFFSTAVVDTKQQQDYLASLSSKISEDMVTRQMLDHAQQNVNADRVLHVQAKTLEDASINALYRLVTKALQALSFIEVLLSVSKKWKLEVQWAHLGAISFRALVVSPKVHENVKKLVTALINDLSNSNNVGVVDQVIDWLTRECSFYFTKGDRCTYEASKLLGMIQKQIKSGSGLTAGSHLWQEVQEQSRHCAQLLLGSAQYWRSVDTVRGENCELWRKCTALLELEQAGRDGVVDLCLAAAENFSAPSDGSAVSGILFSPSRAGGADPFSQSKDLAVASSGNAWEQHLYRDNSLLSEADRLAGEEACFQCLVQHILTVGTDVRRLGAGILPATLPSGENGDPLEVARSAMYKMIVRAVGSCSNMLLHTLLGDRLLRDHQSVLLSVRSAHVEEYLALKDAQLLYRWAQILLNIHSCNFITDTNTHFYISDSYYQLHGDFVKATSLMSGMARSEENVEIGARIAHLHKAVASAEKAVACSSSPAECQRMSEALLDLKDTLDIALYQQQAHAALAEEFAGYNNSSSSRARYTDGQRRSLDLLDRAVQRSRFCLLPITELFHEICLPYKLWDLCLLILHVSKHDDSDLVAKLWRSIIYRYVLLADSSLATFYFVISPAMSMPRRVVPEEGASEESRVFLTMKRDPTRIEVDKR